MIQRQSITFGLTHFKQITGWPNVYLLSGPAAGANKFRSVIHSVLHRFTRWHKYPLFNMPITKHPVKPWNRLSLLENLPVHSLPPVFEFHLILAPVRYHCLISERSSTRVILLGKSSTNIHFNYRLQTNDNRGHLL